MEGIIEAVETEVEVEEIPLLTEEDSQPQYDKKPDRQTRSAMERKRKLNNNLFCWFIGGIPFIGFLLFTLVPMLISFYLSFTRLSSYNFLHSTWIGFQNYIDLFKDKMFYKAIGNTLYALLAVPLTLTAGMLIGLLLRSKVVKGKFAWRIIFFIPYLCSGVVLATTFSWMFDAEFGVINGVLKSLGLPKLGFFRDARMFMPTMFVMMVWNMMGSSGLQFYAALGAVPKEILEAAELDGANARQRFFKITFPLVSPTTFYLFTTGLIAGLQTFVLFQMIGSSLGTIFGGPFGPSDTAITVVYYLYICSFTWLFRFGIGYGSAMSWVLAILVILLTILNFKLQKKWVQYD